MLIFTIGNSFAFVFGITSISDILHNISPSQVVFSHWEYVNGFRICALILEAAYLQFQTELQLDNGSIYDRSIHVVGCISHGDWTTDICQVVNSRHTRISSR